jgi:hypothetical protein
MNNKQFSNAYELIKLNLVNFSVNRAFNSIGSNVFFEFGKERKFVLKNGKESSQKEWSIWIGDASWRITKNGKYIGGSGDSPENIQLSIQKLLGKRFQSLQFLSSFLDVEFHFDDGYQITTFFNWLEENQWTLFLPDQTNISVNCSNYEEIENVQNTASDFLIIENYKKLNFPKNELVLTEITYDDHGQLICCFEDGCSINLENCTWRLEKAQTYLIGCLDEEQDKINKMSELIGKKIKQIDVANSMMDARFQFEDQYVLRTFACCYKVNQWKITSNDNLIFCANIQLDDVSHPEAKEEKHHKFRDKRTGEIIQYDEGQPGETGHEGYDHYHRPNPNSKNKGDYYLDSNGNPVPKGWQLLTKM